MPFFVLFKITDIIENMLDLSNFLITSGPGRGRGSRSAFLPEYTKRQGGVQEAVAVGYSVL